MRQARGKRRGKGRRGKIGKRVEKRKHFRLGAVWVSTPQWVPFPQSPAEDRPHTANDRLPAPKPLLHFREESCYR